VSAVVGAAVPAAVCRWGLRPGCSGVGRCLSGVNNHHHHSLVRYLQVGFYTRLPSPIVYGVWHTQGGSVGGRILRNERAIVLQ